ncbi:MAG: DUF302 domain-containing protein [Magnetococcales bacterium]|nr:DUF302 domain-containing protein [Magnetococcales bacterium]
MSEGYAILKPVSLGYDEAVSAIRAALAEQGFGILSEIDVAATLKKKLGVDHPPTLILGACNPPLAHRAMSAAPDIAVLLPCNVVVRVNAAGGVEIAAVDPMVMARMIDHPEVGQVALEADKKIRAALAAVN